MKIPFWEVVFRPDNLPILFLMPAFLVAFVLWWRAARKNDDLEAEGGLEAVADAMRGPVPEPTRDLGQEDPDRTHTWPYLLRVELLVTLALMTLLTVWSILVDAPLEPRADPSRTPNPSKAPWYFVGLQEMLVYFDPWIAGVVLPGLIILGLSAIPYLDTNPRGDGYYSWRHRRFALSTFWLGMGLWILLIVVGTFFRGPGWGWFWPGEPWDPHRSVDAPSRSWADLFGIEGSLEAALLGGATLLGYYALAAVPWLLFRDRESLKQLGLTRYAITAFLFLTMLSLPLKIGLTWAFRVKYILETPWLRI